MSNDDLIALLATLTEDEVYDLLESLPEPAARALLDALPASQVNLPKNPLEQAVELDDGYRQRPHLEYLSQRLEQAVADVENGISRRIAISMPPRAGKSTLASQYLPVWLLRRHPEWKIGMVSHEASLSTTWGRAVRRWATDHPELGIRIAPDAGAAQEWETREGGGILSRSVGGSITGRGFKVLLLDDLIKDFGAAHSEVLRQGVWDWWLSTASTRLEPPALVIAIGTRWHEDDFIGRLLSAEHEGDPGEWEVISFPAIAEEDDVLGRAVGEPLLTPLVDETPEEALVRWEGVKRDVGSYVWSALYQQRPSPAKGAIFDMSWWRYWTTNPAIANGIDVLYLPDVEQPHGGDTWVEGWDMAFKDTKSSDYVVGQRWVRRGVLRILTAQVRDKWSFTATLPQVRAFSKPHVPTRLIEDKANGTAIIDVLRTEVDGIIAVNPKDSKEVRARAQTPTIEAGNVLLPHPSEPGCEWVRDLLTETRNFPTGAHDDMVDVLVHCLGRLRTAEPMKIGNPSGARKPERARTGSALAAARIQRR